MAFRQNVRGVQMSAVKRMALIVEDDVHWAHETFQWALEEEGIQVEIAHNYGEAVEKLETFSFDFDLLVLDISLSDDPENIEGMKVLRKVADSHRGTPVIMVSGRGATGVEIESLRRLGVVRYMEKEAFDLKEFRNVVRHILSISEVLHPPVPAGPPEPQEVVSTPALVRPLPKDGGKQHILVVDDDEYWRNIVLAEFLAEQGYEVRTAANYQEASNLIAQERFDLVTIDLKLAEDEPIGRVGRGWRLLMKISNLTPKPHIIIISGTAKSEEEVIEAYDKFKVDHFFLKNKFDYQKFIETVHTLLSGKEKQDRIVIHAMLEKEMEQHKRNLYELRRQKATYGAGEEPLRILNQIEAEEKEIQRIEQELKAL
jgi:DNA-binding response OmpR family regulator